MQKKTNISTVVIRKAMAKDTSEIHYCIEMLAKHVEIPSHFVVRLEELEKALFGPNQTHINTFVAETIDTGKIVGYAVTYKTLSTFTGITNYHMEDLFVLSEHRKQGVGLQIMEFITDFAKEKQASKLDWYVHQSNPRAKKFYESLGSERIDAEVKYELSF